MHYFVKSVLVILFILPINIIKANNDTDIYQAKSISEINSFIFSYNNDDDYSDSLVLVPFQEFFLKPQDPELLSDNIELKRLLKKELVKVKAKNIPYMTEILLTEYKYSLQDPDLKDFMAYVQNSRLPIIVYTNQCSGQINNIEYLEVWSWKKLKNLGINLSETRFGNKQFIFNKTAKKVKGSYPTFYRGFLSTNTYDNKNELHSILGNLFATKISWFPKNLYLVNSSVTQIYTVAKQIKQLNPNVNVVGILYTPKEPFVPKISKEKYIKFWRNVAKKVNNLKRKNR